MTVVVEVLYTPVAHSTVLRGDFYVSGTEGTERRQSFQIWGDFWTVRLPI